MSRVVACFCISDSVVGWRYSLCLQVHLCWAVASPYSTHYCPTYLARLSHSQQEYDLVTMFCCSLKKMCGNQKPFR
uniref:Putative secreted protein n=1 Tax=Ixodes ricinus TaxID=34613 RepID=A0A6B0U552_IXORI